MQSDSAMIASFDVISTSMHCVWEGEIGGGGGGQGQRKGVERVKTCLPMRTTGQDFLHSCLHFFGLHLSSCVGRKRGVTTAGRDVSSVERDGGGSYLDDCNTRQLFVGHIKERTPRGREVTATL
jgi:hypothetical protein